MNTKHKQFTDLFNGSKNKLYNVAYGVVMNKEVAEDVLQDSFIKAWRKFDEYDHSKKFINWMSTIVKNAAIDYKRSASKQSYAYSLDAITSSLDNSQTMSFDVEDKQANLYEIYEKKEFMKSLSNMIDDLPEDLKLVMIPFIQGQTYDEISRQSKLSLTTVRARVHRAKKILRNSYDSANFANF